MEVSGHLHTPATLHSQERLPTLIRWLGDSQSQFDCSGYNKISCSCPALHHDLLVLSVALLPYQTRGMYLGSQSHYMQQKRTLLQSSILITIKTTTYGISIQIKLQGNMFRPRSGHLQHFLYINLPTHKCNLFIYFLWSDRNTNK
jgi:hypothetical protein